jgi:hypothetical protein
MKRTVAVSAVALFLGSVTLLLPQNGEAWWGNSYNNGYYPGGGYYPYYGYGQGYYPTTPNANAPQPADSTAQTEGTTQTATAQNPANYYSRNGYYPYYGNGYYPNGGYPYYGNGYNPYGGNYYPYYYNNNNNGPSFMPWNW